MPRYIDAEPYDKVLEQREKALWEIDAPAVADAVGQCRKLLAKQPTVDAVEVVRCKDCKHYKRICEDSNKFMCMITHGLIAAKADDFCSYGERRADHV